ncbi:MAG TPA: hypothetical protein VN230_07790 [Burkholderiaceae bacterium]|nr:hypothetical protein [Burkholderiaceae bacterium]
MTKERALIGANGLPLPILPPERDVRVWAKLTRVVVYTPGFLALLLLKVGEPTGFGITVELLMLASTAAIVAGLFIGTQSDAAGADHSSRVSAWSGGLVLELLCAVPILCAVPGLFHELANSKLLHSATPGAVAVPLGITELLPAVAILPFMLYQLGGFGTLHYVVPRAVNWVINLGILGLILGSTAANRMGAFEVEKALVATLVISMALVVFYGVMKLRQMQAEYDDNLPPKPRKDDK